MFGRQSNFKNTYEINLSILTNSWEHVEKCTIISNWNIKDSLFYEHTVTVRPNDRHKHCSSLSSAASSTVYYPECPPLPWFFVLSQGHGQTCAWALLLAATDPLNHLYHTLLYRGLLNHSANCGSCGSLWLCSALSREMRINTDTW